MTYSAGYVAGAGVVVRRVGQHVAGVRLDAWVAPLLPLVGRQRQRGVAHRRDDVDERHLGDGAGEQVRAHRDARTDEQPAGAPAADGDASRVGPALGDEVLGGGERVGERVALVQQLAVEVPAAARARRRRAGGRAPTPARGRAATGGRRRTTAASTPRRSRSRRPTAGAVPSAGVSTWRTTSTGTARAVRRRRPRARRHVAVEVDAGRRRLLAQRALARDDVDVVDRQRASSATGTTGAATSCPTPGWRRARGRAARRRSRARASRAVAEQHPHPGLGVAPLVQHEVAGERLGDGDPPAGLVGEQLGPLARAVERRRHHAEVRGVEVGQDDEAVAPVVDGVLDVGRARRARARASAVGSSAGMHADLGRRLAGAW